MLSNDEFARAFDEALDKLNSNSLKWISTNRLTERSYVLGIVEFASALGLDVGSRPLFDLMRNLPVSPHDFEKDLFPETRIGQEYAKFRSYSIDFMGSMEAVLKRRTSARSALGFERAHEKLEGAANHLWQAVESFCAHHREIVSHVQNDLGRIRGQLEVIRRGPTIEKLCRQRCEEIYSLSYKLEGPLRALAGHPGEV